MACINKNIKSCAYLYWYLNDVRLNELLHRASNGTLRKDILDAMRHTSYYNNTYNVYTDIVNKKQESNDIYIIIVIQKNGMPLCHLTIHLLMENNISNNKIGPIHIRNNRDKLYASRINLNYNTNTTGNIGKIIFKKSNYTIWKKQHIPNDINQILSTLLNVLNNYFNKNSHMSLDKLTTTQLHSTLGDIITYYKEKKSTIRINQTPLTSKLYGGKTRKQRRSTIRISHT